MELGTGVFLSAIFLGMIALFVATKDRWAWKRIFLKGVGGTIALIAIIGLGTWSYVLYSERAVPQDELSGIKLGMTEQEVKYLKGEPTEISKEGGNWIYIDNNEYKSPYAVKFKDGVAVGLWTWKTVKASLPYVTHISSYANTKDIEEKLGKPTQVSMSKDGFTRMVIYENYRVWFALRQEQIEAVGVFDPVNYKPGFKE